MKRALVIKIKTNAQDHHNEDQDQCPGRQQDRRLAPRLPEDNTAAAKQNHRNSCCGQPQKPCQKILTSGSFAVTWSLRSSPSSCSTTHCKSCCGYLKSPAKRSLLQETLQQLGPQDQAQAAVPRPTEGHRANPQTGGRYQDPQEGLCLCLQDQDSHLCLQTKAPVFISKTKIP